MGEWSKRWQMPFNLDKCKIMHIGHKNKNEKYELLSKEIKSLFRQNTYLQNKKHTLTCQVGLVVTDLITSPVVSWEGWETPPPPPPAPRLSCHSLLNHRRGKTSLLLW